MLRPPKPLGSRANKRAVPALLGALVDPGAEEGDLFFGEGIGFAFGGHHHVFDKTSHGMDEGTFIALAGFDDFAIFAAFKNGFDAVDAELGLLFFFAVAIE